MKGQGINYLYIKLNKKIPEFPSVYLLKNYNLLKRATPQ